MDTLHSLASVAPAARGEASLEAADDELALDAPPRYCPTHLLASFALLMAGHGRCVITDMMLGDREYAMWQLACAQAMDDRELQLLARRLFSYFDDPQQSALPVMGTA